MAKSLPDRNKGDFLTQKIIVALNQFLRVPRLMTCLALFFAINMAIILPSDTK